MEAILKLVYLAAAVCFIFGLKRLSHPRTAVSGNQLAAVGMLAAIIATAFDRQILGYQWIHRHHRWCEHRCYRRAHCQDDRDARNGSPAQRVRWCRICPRGKRGVHPVHDAG